MKREIRAGIIGIAALLGIGCSLHPGQVDIKALLSDRGSIRIDVPAFSSRHTQSRYENIDHIDFTLESVQRAANGAVSTAISTQSLTFDDLTQGGASASVTFHDLWPGVATVSAEVFGVNPVQTQGLHTLMMLNSLGTATATASVVSCHLTEVPLNIKLPDTTTRAGSLHISLGIQEGNEVLLPVPYEVSTFAGNDQGYQDGIGVGSVFVDPSQVAKFDRLGGIAVDSAGNLFVADAGGNSVISYVRKIATDGTVSTFASSDGSHGFIAPDLCYPEGVVLDSKNNLFVCSTGHQNNLITKITPAGVATTLVINDYNVGASRLVCDRDDNLFVSDNKNNRILKITFTAEGNMNGVSLFADGIAPGPFGPGAIVCDANGNLYVSDPSSCVIRKITKEGEVSTFAGIAGECGDTDGPLNAATFVAPWSLACDCNGNLFVGERFSNRIRKITPTGMVFTIAGTDALEFNDGPGNSATFNEPWSMVVGSDGALYINDSNNHRIRRLEQCEGK